MGFESKGRRYRLPSDRFILQDDTKYPRCNLDNMSGSDNWPRPSEEELPDMYEEIDEMLGVINDIVESHFEIKKRGAEERIIFSSVSIDDYLAALDEEPEVMVPFFQKITGLPDREFERQYGVGGVGQRLRKLKTSLKEHDDAEHFAEVLADVMPASLAVETYRYTFFKMWEADQRRFYRMRYETKILELLEENGYPCFKGNTLPGEPDFVIPDSQPYEVIGEVRVIQQKDRVKRFKEFRSEAADAAVNFPDSRFVAVANMGAYIERLDDREALRDEITKSGTSEIGAVFFHDEREEMLNQLKEWNVTRQGRL